MNLESLSVLLLPKQPCCVRTVHSHSDVTDSLLLFRQKHPGLVISFLRGKKMTTVQGLFDEFAAALQFPYYFGNNANAFDECLADLSWLPAKMYALVIFDSADFLVKEPTQLPPFIDAFERICAEWRLDALRGPKGVPAGTAFYHRDTEAQRKRKMQMAFLCVSVTLW